MDREFCLPRARCNYATVSIYHAFGINPASIVHNHLNRPRRFVEGEPVTALFS
jgi:hypothetical protein